MLIFFLCCKTAANVAFLLVYIQNLPRLTGKGLINVSETVGDIFMNRRFTNSKMLRCLSYRAIIINNIVRYLHSAFLNIILQEKPLQ